MVRFVTVRQMYFEGSEKKFELIARHADFRKRSEGYWQALVELAGAKILSKISSPSCDAYLLSESSLFVWEDRVTMITCGTTTLVKAADFLIKDVSPSLIDFFSYQRKNEYYPHEQLTDFRRDVETINANLPGLAYRFGSPDEHHLFLFHYDRPYTPKPLDCTLEILMYDLQGPARELFSPHQTLQRNRELTRMNSIFPEFQLDDYIFDPCGYSLNALRGSEYFTIHVTPEEIGSYVSFETNVRLGDRTQEVLKAVLELFQPRSFDLIYFHPEKELKAFEIPPFFQCNYVRESLACGFEVGFSSYYLKNSEPLPAVKLEVR